VRLRVYAKVNVILNPLVIPRSERDEESAFLAAPDKQQIPRCARNDNPLR
jgi:hypothetical protein